MPKLILQNDEAGFMWQTVWPALGEEYVEPYSIRYRCGTDFIIPSSWCILGDNYGDKHYY